MKFSALAMGLISTGLSFVGAGSASAAPVDIISESAPGSSISAPLNFADSADFDLASRGAAMALLVSVVVREGFSHHYDPFMDAPGGEADRFSTRDTLGPSWSYRQSEGAPEIAFAALGAGKKGRPGLVHLALDWNF